jgi:RNA polymerase sigma-70 factor (ECF subfamily)
MNELVRAHHERVHRFGIRVCRNPGDADDAVQEAFLRLWRRPDVQRHPGVLAWLFAVVRTMCARLLRPFSRRHRFLGDRVDHEDAVPDPELTPDRIVARSEVIARVQRAIDRLAPPYREVIRLRELEGLSAKETCRALGLSAAAMKSRLHRARAMLRVELAHSRVPASTRYR